MEIKKNKKADLERGRTRRYMLSLAIAVAAFFFVLEYESGTEKDDLDDFEETVEELDLSTLKHEEERIALALKEKPKPAPDKVEVVDKIDDLNRMEMPEDRIDEEKGKDNDNNEKKDSLEKDPLLANASNALDANPRNFRVVEDLPQFPGGAVELMKWLTKNLRYPQQAQKKKIEGKVIVQFIVTADGSMSNLQIIKKLEASCDNETMRVMRMMPKWKPGVQDGKPCRTMVCIPIVFKL